MRDRAGRPCGWKSRAGFSILELLLVTAVLMILAAVILPVFVRIREMCYRGRCAANLRQLAGAFTLYAEDWAGFWPSPGGLVGDRSYWSQSGDGGLYPYLKQRGLGSVWCCPLLAEWHGRYPARSYSMNSYLRRRPDQEYPDCTSQLCGIHICRIGEPDRTILLYEGIPLSGKYVDEAYSEDQIFYVYRCANWSWARGYRDKCQHAIDPHKPWHGRFNNYLICDGHVIARPPGRKTNGSYSTYQEMYWWYVDKAYFAREYRRYAPQ